MTTPIRPHKQPCLSNMLADDGDEDGDEENDPKSKAADAVRDADKDSVDGIVSILLHWLYVLLLLLGKGLPGSSTFNLRGPLKGGV